MKAGTFAGFPFVACTYTTVHLHERLQYIFPCLTCVSFYPYIQNDQRNPEYTSELPEKFFLQKRKKWFVIDFCKSGVH